MDGLILTENLYLSPNLVKKFAGDRELLKPGAKKEMLTILFTGIARLNSVSEGMDSDNLAHHMNLYFETASRSASITLAADCEIAKRL